MHALLTLIALYTSPAHAQQEVCGAEYTSETMDTHLAAAEDAFRAFDLDGAREILKGTHKSTLCFGEVASPARIAKLARLLGLVFFLEQDDDSVYRWSLSQQYAWKELPWPSDLGDHPYRYDSEDAELPPANGPENTGLVVPKKGAFFANGRFLATPIAPSEVPLFVQVTDKKGTIIQQYWQDGAGFPEKMLIEGGEPLETPRWYEPEDSAAVGYSDRPLFEDAVADAAEEPIEEPEPVVEEPEPVAEEPEPVVEEPEPVAEEPEPVVEEPEPVVEEPEPVVEEPEPVVEEPEPALVSLPERTREVAIPTFAAVAMVEDYVDPFEDARLRAIARETTVRKDVDQATGMERTITTDVITFAVDDGERHAATYTEFADWLPYHPEWSLEEAKSSGLAPKNYLKDWKRGEVPAARDDVPVVWVPLGVATAYCDDWAAGLEDASVEAEQAVREWRLQDGVGVIRERDGSISAADPNTVASDLGFRCR